MINKAINKIMRRHHFWRTVSFDELSEIYTSQLLRSLAASLVGIFVPIYLYKIGYSLIAICFMFVVWFMVKPVWAYVSARVIAAYGPKHTIAISVIFQILYLSLILTLESFNWPLWMIGVMGSLCYTMFMMAFFVDFSKIKHSEHGGKELGFLNIFERIGAVAGPLVGGIVATVFDPRYTIALAILVLCGSLIPIFMTSEPVRTHQIIRLKGFPIRRHKRDFLVGTAFQLENVISVTIWPLFLGIFILTVNTYAALGVITAVSTAIALVAVVIIGKRIDDQKGRQMLNIGASINAVLHLMRPFVTNMAQALGVSIVNEPVTAMYRMPYLKGRFDASDSVPGYRIVYFMINEIYLGIANVIFWMSLILLLLVIPDKLALQVTFIIAAILSLCITRQRFRALQ